MTKDEITNLEAQCMNRVNEMDPLTAALTYRCLYLTGLRIEQAESTIRKARDEARKT